MNRVYKQNPKHKIGARAGGPPRWFPDSASKCPEDMTERDGQRLLDESIEAPEETHPNSRARFAVYMEQIFKAYAEGASATDESWHGYPLAANDVPTQVPTSVLRTFLQTGLINRATYNRLRKGSE